MRNRHRLMAMRRNSVAEFERMSFLKTLQKTVGEIARVGLDKMGISYTPIPDGNDDDDPDTRTRDFIDIYRDVTTAWKSSDALPVAQSARVHYMALVDRYGHENAGVRKAVEAWFDDRRVIADIVSHPEKDAPDAAQDAQSEDKTSLRARKPALSTAKSDAATLRREFFQILAHYGVLQLHKSPRVSSLFEVCDAQGRMVKNLLSQADRQVREEWARNAQVGRVSDCNGTSSEHAFTEWVLSMNARLEPFNIAVTVVDDWVTVVGGDDLPQDSSDEI